MALSGDGALGGGQGRLGARGVGTARILIGGKLNAELNRGGLDVLVHPLTKDAVEDHSSYAIWLRNPVDLKLHTLPRGHGGRLPSGVSAQVSSNVQNSTLLLPYRLMLPRLPYRSQTESSRSP